MPIDKITALSQIAAFSRLPHALIEQLASVAGIQRIGRGSALFREGEHADFVYALVKGGVSLICGPNSAKTVADFIAAGDLILVPPALLDLPYMVTAQAVTDLLVVMIPTPEFRRLAETELPLAVALNHLLAGHWRFLLRHLTHTKSRDADARLVQFLIDSADVTSGTVHLALPGSKRNLAAHLGVTPETLSRSFKRLSPLGVKTTGLSIQIENVARLGAFSRGRMGPRKRARS